MLVAAFCALLISVVGIAASQASVYTGSSGSLSASADFNLIGSTLTVTLTNTSSKTVGFFLRTDLRRSDNSSEIPSALWSTDDTTLFPGESETVSVSYGASDLSGTTPVISLSGWNVAAQNVTLG